jgi:hypothetical protein
MLHKWLFSRFKQCLNCPVSTRSHAPPVLNMFRLNTRLNSNLRLDASCLNNRAIVTDDNYWNVPQYHTVLVFSNPPTVNAERLQGKIGLLQEGSQSGERIFIIERHRVDGEVLQNRKLDLH